MIKLGYPLAILVLISMVIPASAQYSDEDEKIREEIHACFEKVYANEDLTEAEKTVAKRNCETEINNKYETMNNNHQDLADERNRIQVIQKCEDWYSSYKLLDEKQWKIQKHTDQATDCLMLYNDDVWNYDGNDRLTVLSEKLMELKEEQSLKPSPVSTSISLPSQSNIIAQDTRSDKMIQLETKIAELEEQIRKKDAVIMEQMKVITDLANMVRNAILNAIVPNGGFF